MSIWTRCGAVATILVYALAHVVEASFRFDSVISHCEVSIVASIQQSSTQMRIWNFKLLAHHELDGFGSIGEGMSIQLAADGRRILWLAHWGAPKNFTGVDVSDRVAAIRNAFQLTGGVR